MTNAWVDYVVVQLKTQGKNDLADKIEFAKNQVPSKLTKVVTVIDRTTSSNADGLIGGVTVVRVN